MATKNSASYLGLKTFFVAPDLTVVSDAFLESAFLQANETYIIADDHYLDIESKVEMLTQSFNELILFFTIDKIGTMQTWIEYINRLQVKYGDKLRIGVLYKSLYSKETNNQLKQIFLYKIGITCGCIPMRFSIPKNQTLLLNVLLANQAQGRRKSIRMRCSDKHTFNIIIQGTQLFGQVLDLSISHFSCSFGGQDPKLEIWTLFQRIQLRLCGIICMVDAALALKRIVDDKTIYVFVFRHGNQEGLDDNMKGKVNKLICDQYQDGMGLLLRELYENPSAMMEKTIKPVEVYASEGCSFVG